MESANSSSSFSLVELYIIALVLLSSISFTLALAGTNTEEVVYVKLTLSLVYFSNRIDAVALTLLQQQRHVDKFTIKELIGCDY